MSTTTSPTTSPTTGPGRELPGLTAPDAQRPPTGGDVEAAVGALCARLMESTVHVAEMSTVYLGERLGLYRAVHRLGRTTAPALAHEVGLSARYVQEWCEQQAVAGLIAVDDVAADPDERLFSLPAGHEVVLAEPSSPAYLAPLGLMAMGVTAGLPAVAEAFRSGAGVPMAAYGSAGRQAQEALNRSTYLLGVQGWVEMLPDVATALSRPGARIADIGAGCGWSSVALAQAFPQADVVAVDIDPASVERAREVVAAAGAADRVTVVQGDATDGLGPLAGEGFDLVTVFEALHDTARPVDVLAGVRTLLRPGGAVLVGEPGAQESFTAPGELLERLIMASSVLFCLPSAMAGPDPEPTGGAMRPPTMRALARRAGFETVTVLPTTDPMWRFFRLDP